MLAGRCDPKLLAPRGRGFTELDGQAPIGAMQTGLEQAGNGLVRHAEFVAARAWHSAGSIITGTDVARADSCRQILHAGPLACAPLGVARSTAMSRTGTSCPNQGGFDSPV
ncbi:hypothetical protein HAP47_0013385 [Bradyrhizobium sp. 41S5]|uniref:hypothetical protein n=1 Tax=Bradyrhizobium sp. 41S5 TaxID=1404443 RepID=UPI00156B1132|nr:hypothetical protein [Bradyrhizobium sp. 41S5]UFX47597.1 hypothetical protein HAP47_0013385 [Bradyrhizobium sp. 41S5]